MTAALEARAGCFRHPGGERPAIDNVSLVVEEGSFTGLLGPNGAGKTTFVHLVCGLLEPSNGRLEIFGSAGTTRAAHLAIGFCPQELAVYPTLTAAENLRFFGSLAGLAGAKLRSRVDVCLDTASLTGEANARVERFSGGMKRRLNLAAALMHEPRLLLLDEPTVGVDAQSRLAIFEALETLHASGTTIVYTTHYMEEVERLCETVIVIDHGQILAEGSTSELIGRENQAHRFRVTVAAGADAIAAALERDGLQAQVVSEHELDLSGSDLASLTGAITRLAESGDISRVESYRPSLEERFLQLTGEELRD